MEQINRIYGLVKKQVAQIEHRIEAYADQEHIESFNMQCGDRFVAVRELNGSPQKHFYAGDFCAICGVTGESICRILDLHSSQGDQSCSEYGNLQHTSKQQWLQDSCLALRNNVKPPRLLTRHPEENLLHELSQLVQRELPSRKSCLSLPFEAFFRLYSQDRNLDRSL